MHKIILASTSTARKALLEAIKLPFSIAAPTIDELHYRNKIPSELAISLAQAKAKSLSSHYPNHLIIGSDQVAMLNNLQLTKPGSIKNNIAQLKLCANQEVKFYTSVSVLNTASGKQRTELDITTVQFKALSNQQIEQYVNIEPSIHCAGGFQMEKRGIALFKRIETEDPNALIGLPVIKLISILEHFGVHLF
ncbi:MAG: nucleoside triphosphate pyrophosphatase [Methylococcales bacterium]|jgi:MAF protein|nr:septum formation protein Maf [Methylococcaceae bacterium]HIL40723.1 septum formation protein Maf [Methylococcales bacterium]